MSHAPLHYERLRLRHFRLLQLIDERGSLRSAAAELNLTQPAVSQILKDLELALGVPLVDRSVRGVVLTDTGRLALRRSRSGLATLDQLVRELDAGQTLSLRIGTNSALIYNIIPEALRRLNVGGTDTRFQLKTGLVGDMVEALSEGELDCYVGRLDWEQVPPRIARLLTYDPMLETDLILICPVAHPVALMKNPKARDLVGWPWAMPSRDSNNRIVLESAMRSTGAASLTAAVEVSADPNGLINLALALGMLTCVPRVALNEHSQARDLKVLDVADLELSSIPIGFATTAELRQMPEIADLRDAMIGAADAWAGRENRGASS